MTTKVLTYIVLLLFNGLAFAQVGNKCVVKQTGNSGSCQISSDCPLVEQQAKVGISPTLCGFHLNRPIVCCEGTPASNSGSSNKPSANENTLLNSETLVYPDNNFDSVPLSNGPASKNEQRCVEYSKNITTVVGALPLITDAAPININIVKCDYNGVPLIVGGSPASAGEFPFMAAIGFKDSNDNQIHWNCGGTLISDYYILTAAHCAATPAYGDPVRIRLGELNLKRSDDGSHPVDYTISNIIIHPNYQRPVKYNDIALLQTSSKVQFTNFIRPACLWNKFNFEHDKAIATGWGKTENDDSSDKLLKVALNIIESRRCTRTYQNSKRQLPEGIKSTMMCAGELKGGKDTCQGDSGGPLIVTKKGNQCVFYIIGVTSFGKVCGAANSPAVYTRISEYVQWIERTIW